MEGLKFWGVWSIITIVMAIIIVLIFWGAGCFEEGFEEGFGEEGCRKEYKGDAQIWCEEQGGYYIKGGLFGTGNCEFPPVKGDKNL